MDRQAIQPSRHQPPTTTSAATHSSSATTPIAHSISVSGEPVHIHKHSDAGAARRLLRLRASDYLLIGLLLAWLAPWVTFFVCITVSVYSRARLLPRFRDTIRILNELIVENTGNKQLADFIAPIPAGTKIRWVETERGTIPLEEA